MSWGQEQAPGEQLGACQAEEAATSKGWIVLYQEEAEGWRVGRAEDNEEKIGPIKKYDMAYGKKNNTEPGITRFWIPVLDLLYYIRVDFRKHVFIHALHKTQRLIMTSITDIINEHE